MSDNQNQQSQSIEIKDITFELARSRYDLLEKIVSSLLVEGVDYGRMPGVAEPFLKKPGAEKLRGHFQLRAIPTLADHREDWEKGLFFYRYRATIYTARGEEVAAAERACTNQEDKFKFRWVDAPEPASKEIEKQMRRAKKGRWDDDDNGDVHWQEKAEVENPFGQVNDTIARSQKRAIVAATVDAFSATGFFAKEGAKAKPKKDKTPDGSTQFWIKRRELKVDDQTARAIAAEVEAGKINWQQAIEKLPKK